MKTAPLPPCSLLSRCEGGALRVLVICLGVLSLAVIGWLMILPKELQSLYGMGCLLALSALWLLLLAGWIVSRFQKRHPLARNGLALAVLGVLLFPFIGPPLAGILFVAGLILWAIGLSL